MTEPDQKYYRVKAPIAQIRRLNAEEIAGVPHSVVRERGDAIDAGYLYYGNRVPLWAHESQIKQNLDNNLIREVTREEYETLPAEPVHKFYEPNAVDQAQIEADIERKYSHL